MSRTSPRTFKVPELTAPPRKNRTISFRVTDDIYEVIEVASEQNNMNFSTLLSFMIRDYLEIQGVTHKKAKYFNTINDEERERIMRQESDLPPEFRDFDLARKSYPNAGRLDDYISGGGTGAAT